MNRHFELNIWPMNWFIHFSISYPTLLPSCSITQCKLEGLRSSWVLELSYFPFPEVSSAWIDWNLGLDKFLPPLLVWWPILEHLRQILGIDSIRRYSSSWSTDRCRYMPKRTSIGWFLVECIHPKAMKRGAKLTFIITARLCSDILQWLRRLPFNSYSFSLSSEKYKYYIRSFNWILYLQLWIKLSLNY